ncbi:MAG TPA: peptidyl-prolyl cis-trans isomerase [Polyangiaceae bacterium]|nr:peptidyl-prolyl cis-trans isomerase [Polyangiaceae bacterium]
MPLAVALAAACGERSSAPEPARAALPPGVAAVAGGEQITVGTVERIARAEGVTLLEARQRGVTDALFSAAFRTDPSNAALVAGAERGALARALLERIRDDAHALGPPSDAEVRELTELRWPEFDRPPSAMTTHAVVLVKKPADDAPAKALAADLAVALKGAADGEELIRRAHAFPARGLQITAEHLPPVTLDGRVWDPNASPPTPLGGSLDLDFARAALALEHPGDQSGVVKSAFGYHVIELDRRFPELRVPLEERRRVFAADVYSGRAKRELDGLVARLRASTPVSTERAVDALTALVPVAP